MERCNHAFENFMKWCATKNVTDAISEYVLLATFWENRSYSNLLSSLKSDYFKLKLTISMYKIQEQK